ncbi:uncharacterized protein LOC131233476 isoform X2 [Magnolia sinica]|uniref:uncharacterized protein LOC131233476 isoform X2 n=1 Tax=Magnolia sinica TaxID=86752 RepID=UPI002658FE90|nr:uncharacterized protein LOC131233476 isoform X2 [Magnolia sinica]XP_058086173.1 uncharacterized protein LOC131233476 isoform X2 [Magnolia sinica]
MNPDSSKSNSHFAKTICSICYEDLKPTLEDLQSISICGHVFHELCLQQWLEYCPSGKKSSCPVCKQACSHKNVGRLYFQSIGGEPTQSIPSHQPSDSADTNALSAEVKRLELKLSGLNSAHERQQQLLNELNKELSINKERAKKEELLKEDALKEKVCIRELLRMKTEELARSTVECSRLKERSIALAKELATLKLVSDVTLEEEEVVKLASIGGGSNKEQTIDILKKSLVLRNKSYKELMAQCNLLGRGETRSLKKLEKAEERIKKLKTRLHELERAIEEKDNETLRAIKASWRATAEGIDMSGVKQNSISAPVGKCLPEDKTEKTVDFMSNSKVNSSSKTNCSLHLKTAWNVSESQKDLGLATSEKNNDIIDIDLETDPFFWLDGDVAKLSAIAPDSCVRGQRSMVGCSGSNPSTEHDKGNRHDGAMDEDVMYVNHSNVAAETMPPDIVLEDAPFLPIKRESSEGPELIARPGDQCLPGGLLGPEGANRYVGKWSRRTQSKVPSSATSTGDLIAVGADGRGGRIKVLRSQNQLLDGKGSSLWPKRCKYGAKQGGQSQGCLQIEHFFLKKGSS